jgi:UDP-N-acetylmuramyl pentapeptide phosphotransferase/UDP-N-acetylglucosamine-1-phosphate transferase
MAPEIAGIWAAPLACCLIGAGYYVHCRVRGFLPEDVPGIGRKQHERSTPLAGIALLPALLLWPIANGQWVLAAATLSLAVLGHVDDLRKARGGLPWQAKTLVLALATAAVAAQHAGYSLSFAFAAAFALAFVLVNATNFLDNTNGACAAITAGSILGNFSVPGWYWASQQTYLGWAALGFLPWNWPRARVFLGDAGAYALGIGLADQALGNLPLGSLSASTNAVQVSRTWDYWPLGVLLVLPFAVQLIDFVQVVTARLWLGIAPWHGDRRHLTHIVQNHGLRPVLVAPLFFLISLGCGLSVRWMKHRGVS